MKPTKKQFAELLDLLNYWGKPANEKGLHTKDKHFVDDMFLSFKHWEISLNLEKKK